MEVVDRETVESWDAVLEGYERVVKGKKEVPQQTPAQRRARTAQQTGVGKKKKREDTMLG